MKEVLLVILICAFYYGIVRRPYGIREGLVALALAVGVLLLGFVTPSEALRSILGSTTHPWHIAVFLITFSVLSTTLDDLGFFKWCAIRMTRLARHDGRVLFTYLFLLTFVVTFFTSNDILILTLTPFVLHIGLHHNKHPKAYLYTMFFVANTGSFGHILGNLTNLIVAQAFQITFVESLAVLAVPLAAATLVQYYILKWYFRKEISTTFDVTTKIDEAKVVRDWLRVSIVLGLLFSVIVMAIMQPFHGIALWIITTAAALMTIAVAGFAVMERIVRLPWNVVLFVGSLFIVLSALENTRAFDGLIALFSSIAQLPVLALGPVATLIASMIPAVMNNIPATLFMTNALYFSGLTGTKLSIMIYSIIIGSNLGANLTIIGALAGLMWLGLVREKGYHLSIWEFTKIGALSTLPAILVAGTVLSLVLSY